MKEYTDEELTTYREIRELAMQDKKAQILKDYTWKQIKFAYDLVGAHYNLSTPSTCTKWTLVIKEARDDLANKAQLQKFLAKAQEERKADVHTKTAKLMVEKK